MKWISVVAVAWLALSAPAQGSIVLGGDRGVEPRFLVAGEAIQIEIVPRGASLRAVYRPGSRVEQHVGVERAADGTIRFVPREAGLLELRVVVQGPGPGLERVVASRVVSVRFASIVSLGLLVMVAAGVILFGGAFLSIRALVRSP